MSKKPEKNNKLNNAASEKSEQQYSLNDDRRVKVLSPGALVAKRFFRNRMAMVGLIILIAMFAFSFIGGLISPYSEDQLFYRTDILEKEYASAIQNTEFRYLTAEGQEFPSVVQAKMILAVNQNQTECEYDGINYTVAKEGNDLYSVSLTDGTLIGIGYKDIFNTNTSDKLPFGLVFEALKAYTNDLDSFIYEDVEYSIDIDGTVSNAEGELGYISRYFVQALMPDVFPTREFKEDLYEALEKGSDGRHGIRLHHPLQRRLQKIHDQAGHRIPRLRHLRLPEQQALARHRPQRHGYAHATDVRRTRFASHRFHR